MADLLPTNLQNLLIESLADLAPMVLSKNHPSIDRFKKEKMGGSAARIPIVTGYGGGAGGDFAISLQNAQSGVVTDAAFDLKPAVLYGHTTLNWTTQRFTSVAESSALDVATLATKGAMENATDNFASAAIFSDGSGTLATIKTATNTSGSIWDLTLTSITDVSKFYQNQVIVTAASVSASLDAGSAVVKGMQQLAGIITVDVGATGLTPTATHIIGLQGQLNSGTNFAGIFGFIPTISARSAAGLPSVTPFNGVDRSAQSAGVAVYGWAFDISGQPFFYGMNQGAGAMANYKNAKPDCAFVNPVDLPKLAQEMDAKVLNDMPSKSGHGEILYSGFTANFSTGPCDFLGEPACPAGTAVLTRGDQWTIGSPETPFGPASKGQIMVQNFQTNEARFSVEMSGYFFTNNPPATAIFKLY
jgi:hypothetical protein